MLSRRGRLRDSGYGGLWNTWTFSAHRITLTFVYPSTEPPSEPEAFTIVTTIMTRINAMGGRAPQAAKEAVKASALGRSGESEEIA
jgi:hypothetical protein